MLGYDMQLSQQGQPNWHDRLIVKPAADNYVKFSERFKYVVRDLKAKWPSVEVWNVTDHSSLESFPKIGVKAFWDERKVK